MRGGCLLALACVGCLHFDMGAGAPGHSDVLRPPEVPALREVEVARSPGVQMLVLTPSVAGLLGADVPTNTGHGLYTLGGELSLTWGTAPGHNHEGGPLVPFPVLPERGWGLAFGAYTLYRLPPDDAPTKRSLQVQLEVRRRFRPTIEVGAGALHRPGDDRTGGLASALLGPLLFRAGYVAGEGAFGLIGLDIGYPITWLWTR
jgi:hypothetical protein